MDNEYIDPNREIRPDFITEDHLNKSRTAWNNEKRLGEEIEAHAENAFRDAGGLNWRIAKTANDVDMLMSRPKADQFKFAEDLRGLSEEMNIQSRDYIRSNVYMENDRAAPPVHVAQTGEVATALIEKYGASVEATSYAKIAPLHRAVNADVANVLLDHGANPNARDIHDRTPLHSNENVDVLQTIGARGGDIYAKDKWGQPTLSAAREDLTHTLVDGIAMGEDGRARVVQNETSASAKPFVQASNIAKTMRDDMAGPSRSTVQTDHYHQTQSV